MKVATGIYGLVLAGGKSSRMGRNKSLINFHGVPQKDYVFSLLEKFCDEVYTSVSRDSDGVSYKNPIPDNFTFSSPLNGILSAFERNKDVAWLSVPVDMPFINENALDYLIAARDRGKSATCFYDSTGKLPEPLFTIWEASSFARMKAFANSGQISPREFLLGERIKLLKAPIGEMLVNVNTQEEFESFARGKLK